MNEGDFEEEAKKRKEGGEPILHFLFKKRKKKKMEKKEQKKKYKTNHKNQPFCTKLERERSRRTLPRVLSFEELHQQTFTGYFHPIVSYI